MFWFDIQPPGQYTVRAEKQGYTGSAVVDITRADLPDDFIANVTLHSYHVPVLSPEQLSLKGGIAGIVMDADGYERYGVKVTLWQNGVEVPIPGNPQESGFLDVAGLKPSYRFEHLAPGMYQVVFDYHSPEKQKDSITVNVTDDIACGDIELSHSYPSAPPDAKTIVIGPPSSAGLDVVLALSSLCIAVLFIGRSRLR